MCSVVNIVVNLFKNDKFVSLRCNFEYYGTIA